MSAQVILATPPLVVERDGRFYVELVDGERSWLAPIGDGAWFFGRVVEVIVKPALIAAEKARK